MAGLVTPFRGETDGNILGGCEEGRNKQINKTPPKTHAKDKYSPGNHLNGGDAAQGCEGGFFCWFGIKPLSPSHLLEIAKAKQRVLRDGVSSVHGEYSQLSQFPRLFNRPAPSVTGCGGGCRVTANPAWSPWRYHLAEMAILLIAYSHCEQVLPQFLQGEL